jgi:hypothetical protein
VRTTVRIAGTTTRGCRLRRLSLERRRRPGKPARIPSIYSQQATDGRPKKPNKLQPRLPRGFADRGPDDIRAVERMMATIRGVYERYGFEPVETPFVEYTDALGSSCPTRTGRTRVSSRSRTTTSSGSRSAMT